MIDLKRILINKFTNKHKILLACFPKSGSTYISKVVASHKDFENCSLVPSHDRREQELGIEELNKFINKNYIAQHHIRFSRYTKFLISQFKLTPIVLVRNIFDIIPSFANHLQQGNLELPMFYFSQDIKSLSDKDLYVYLSYTIIPWYINFYVGWIKNLGHENFITYEDMVKDKEKFFQEFFLRFGYKLNSKEINEMISSTDLVDTKFNIGKINRGQTIPLEAKDHIKKIVSIFKDINFELIGIDQL